MRTLCWLVVVACSGSKPDPTPEPPKPATPAPAPEAPKGSACADRAARMTKHMQELAAATPGFMPYSAISAPAAAGKPFDERGFVVGVQRDGKVVMQGSVFASQKEAFDMLDAMSKKASEDYAMAGDGPLSKAKFQLYIWADKDAPASAVAGLVASANKASDHFAMRLLVAGGTHPARVDISPATVGLTQQMPANEPDSTKYLVDQLKKSMGTCSKVITPLATASMQSLPKATTDQLVKGLPAGLVACDCKIPDPDAFEWGVYTWFGESAPALAWIELPKIAAGEKKPIGKLVH